MAEMHRYDEMSKVPVCSRDDWVRLVAGNPGIVFGTLLSCCRSELIPGSSISALFVKVGGVARLSLILIPWENIIRRTHPHRTTHWICTRRSGNKTEERCKPSDSIGRLCPLSLVPSQDME